MLVNSRQTKGHVRSFEPKYVGPYLVLEKVNDVNFLIKDPESRRLSIVHYNRMVRYKTASEAKSAVAEEELLNENAIDHRMIAQRVRRRRAAGRKEDENLPALEHDDQPSEEESEAGEERSVDGGFSELDVDDQQNQKKVESDETSAEGEEQSEHKCGKCDFACLTEHGLAVHVGKKHKTD